MAQISHSVATSMPIRTEPTGLRHRALGLGARVEVNSSYYTKKSCSKTILPHPPCFLIISFPQVVMDPRASSLPLSGTNAYSIPVLG